MEKGINAIFPLPGRQNTIFFPFHLALIASISQSSAFFLGFGGTVFTVNPFAIALIEISLSL